MLHKIKSYGYYIATIASMAIVSGPTKALAISGGQLNEIKPSIITTNQNGVGILTSAAAVVINIILLIAGILAVIYLVYAGIQYVTAGGDTGKAEKGRTGIVNAIIGLVIIAAAYLIVRFVGSILGTAPSEGNTIVNTVY